jgi:hypothetical protein
VLKNSILEDWLAYPQQHRNLVQHSLYLEVESVDVSDDAGDNDLALLLGGREVLDELKYLVGAGLSFEHRINIR